jgi:hypothetical protein
MPRRRTAWAKPIGTPVKRPRTEHPEGFSNAVRKKMQFSSRTGQACDRCKVSISSLTALTRGISTLITTTLISSIQVRKLRCDKLPRGCLSCMRIHAECRTTDRITGRATSRGYVAGLEQQNQDLQDRIEGLKKHLMRNGIDVGPSNDQNLTVYGSEIHQPSSTVQPTAFGTAGATYTSQAGEGLQAPRQETGLFHAPPSSHTDYAGWTGEDYLGVSLGNPTLSIQGTALSILGMETDIAGFDSPDTDEPDPSDFHTQLYNRSYQAFIRTVLNVNPRLEKVDLPGRVEGMMYAEWYFRVVNPYFPVLHKPTFLTMVSS